MEKRKITPAIYKHVKQLAKELVKSAALGVALVGTLFYATQNPAYEIPNRPNAPSLEARDKPSKSLEEKVNLLIITDRDFERHYQGDKVYFSEVTSRENVFSYLGNIESTDAVAAKNESVFNPTFIMNDGGERELYGRKVTSDDNISLEVIDKGEDIINVLGNYKGPKLDRILISTHGFNYGVRPANSTNPLTVSTELSIVGATTGLFTSQARASANVSLLSKSLFELHEETKIFPPLSIRFVRSFWE